HTRSYGDWSSDVCSSDLARRALCVSRSAIAELSGPADATAHEVLEAIACELRRRFEIVIALDVELTHDLLPDVQENVSRIVRERSEERRVGKEWKARWCE